MACKLLTVFFSFDSPRRLITRPILQDRPEAPRGMRVCPASGRRIRRPVLRKNVPVHSQREP